MPDVPLVTFTIRRRRGEATQCPLVNMFLEEALAEPRNFSLLPHPGLEEEGTTLGNQSVLALYRQDGVLSGSRAAVSGGRLYVDSTQCGTIDVVNTPSIAGNEVGVVAAAGGDAVFFDGSTLSTVILAGVSELCKVIEQGGRFILLAAGTGQFYWTQVLAEMLNGDDEIEIDALDFATAESEPDQLVDAVAFEDRIAFGGLTTIEFWFRTGDSELPYTPSTGMVFQKGVRATGCMVRFDNTFAWVSPDNIVYRAGNVPERISDAGIEEIIAASTTCRVDAYYFEGHEFLKILLDAQCVEYDAQTRQWAERKTGTENFMGGPVIAGPVFGSTQDGRLLEASGYADFGGDHERSFCISLPVSGGALPVDCLRLRTNPGHTEYLTGSYTDPTVELFQSYDGGQTFDVPLEEQLGEQGEYRREVEWRALGSADPPGFFAKIRVTDPVSFRCSGASINEPHGGRSR